MGQRLIDANQMAVDEFEAYISAQVQITDGLKLLVNFAAHSKIQSLIADTPTVDAVPVVRCKDCKRWQRHSEINRDYGGCRRYSSTMRYDDFCSQGERRAENASKEM